MCWNSVEIVRINGKNRETGLYSNNGITGKKFFLVLNVLYKYVLCYSEKSTDIGCLLGLAS